MNLGIQRDPRPKDPPLYATGILPPDYPSTAQNERRSERAESHLHEQGDLPSLLGEGQTIHDVYFASRSRMDFCA